MTMPKLRGASWGPFLAAAALTAGCTPAKSAADVERIGSTKAFGNATYYVSIKDSPDLKKKIDDSCAQKHAEDPNARASCVQTATKVSAGEGMRFVKGADNRWSWVNFGTDANG